MNLPKNIMQIGNVDKNLKVYIEDYVYTFMKQVEQQNKGALFSYILFGTEEWQNNCRYLFVYGAIEEREGGKIVQEDYFKRYQKIGKLKTNTLQKKIYLKRGEGIAIEGFYIFYEQNPEMQSYLVHMNRKIEVTEHTYHARGMKKSNGVIGDEKIESIEKERINIGRAKIQELKSKNGKTAQQLIIRPKFKMASIWTCLMTLMIIAVVVGTVNGYETMNQFVDSIARVLSMQEKNSEVDTPLMIVEKTTEEKLQEEMQQEQTGVYMEQQPEVENIVLTNDIKSDGGTEGTENTEAVVSNEVIIEEVKSEEEAVTELEEIKHEVYIIQEGDTLAAVCEARYKSTDKIREVCNLNHIENPDKIIQGQAIMLPLE